jgi:hypothetical protein
MYFILLYTLTFLAYSPYSERNERMLLRSHAVYLSCQLPNAELKGSDDGVQYRITFRITEFVGFAHCPEF